MAVISICRHNQAGFCKFGEKCRNRHIDEICGSDKCDDEDCFLRHPMACRFFSLNGICKFGSGCAYLHKESEEKTKIRRLEEQLDATVEKVKELENIVKKFYSKLEEQFREEPHDDNLQTVAGPEPDEEDKAFTCAICDFKSSWQKGMFVHMGRKHTMIEQLDGLNKSVDDEEEDTVYLNTETYWKDETLGRSYQAFLDANKLIDESALNEDDKENEKIRVLAARKEAFGDDFKYYPPWS